MIDVKDSSKNSGSTLHGPAPAQRSRWRLEVLQEVFEVCFKSRVWQLKYVRVRKVKRGWIARVAGVRGRFALQLTLLCSYAPGEPLGRRQGESIPPAGTRGEVGSGVSDEPSGSPVRRICVEQAGEGRGFGGEGEKALITQRQLALKVGWRYEKSKAVML